jgi:O-antigen/teichoic acid export membrane protein
MTTDDQNCTPPVSARSALISLSWNYAGSVVAILFQLGYTAYTGRTVTPNFFGVYAIALTAVQFVSYFANAGLSGCLLRAKRLTLPTVRATRRLGAASGIVCFAVVELAAPGCAAMWRMPELTPVLRLLGSQFLLQPLGAVAVATLRRIGRARAAAIVELTGQGAGMAVAVTLLECGWSPLGMAAAQPVAAALTLMVGAPWVATCRLPGGPPVRARDLLTSSGFLTCYSLMQFAMNSAPMWVAGRVLGASAAGSYSRASLLTGLPLTFLSQGLNKTTMPLIAERREQGLPLNRTVEHAMVAASAAAFIGFGALAGIGPAVAGVLLGPGWGTAEALVPVLAVGSAMALLCSSASSVDVARHASRAMVGTQLTLAATTAAGVAVAATAHSLLLLAVAAGAGPAAGHIVQLVRWHRIGLLSSGVVVRTHLIHAVIGASLGGAAALGGLGRSPVAALAYGLAFMLPVMAACVLLRAWLPLYATAMATGLLRPQGELLGAGTPSG